MSNFPHLESVTALFSDSNGIMRGKVLPAEALEKLLGGEASVFLPASVFGTDSTGESVAETGLVWESGDVDFPWRAIPETFHILPGSDNKQAAVLIEMLQEDGTTPHFLDPRGILREVVKRLNAEGLFPMVAHELEFYLIAERNDKKGMGQRAEVGDSGRIRETNQVYEIDAYSEFASVLDEISSVCRAISVGADARIAEYGRGQFEINLTHSDDVLRACDEAVLLRHLTRRVARAAGIDATFMGKPFADDTGSGFHFHVSLWDSKAKNLMAEQKGREAWSNTNIAHGAGGMAQHLGESMAVFAPNANAWRRLQPGHYAPTDKSWGYNNRTVSFRIPPGDASARRLEHRSSSADVNIYLASALILAAMAEGIKNKTKPPTMITGNAYDAPNREGLPRHWLEALEMFSASAFIGEWLGEDYRHVYTEMKRYECRAFESQVTPLEWAWYR